MKLSFAAALAACLVAGSASNADAKPRKPAAPQAPATPQAPQPSDFRPVDPDNMLVVDTNKGRIIVELAPAVAPNAVERIKTLARQHFYDGQTFFRVIGDFMDQTGDPTNKGEGGSTLPNLKAEFVFRRGPESGFVPVASPDTSLAGFIGVMPVMTQQDDLMLMTADGKVAAWPLFCQGVMGMARNADPDSGNSQFFFMRGAYPSLEKKYTAWGRVVMGQEVVEAIKTGEPVPDPQDKMLTVRLGSDMPAATRPNVYVLDTRTQAFKNLVERERSSKGADFSTCSLEIPSELR